MNLMAYQKQRYSKNRYCDYFTTVKKNKNFENSTRPLGGSVDLPPS